MAEDPQPQADAGGPSWKSLPEHLGIEVCVGDVPESLPGARRPNPWSEVTDDAVIVRLLGGSAVCVRDGRSATIQLARDGTGDPSWIAQGWAVTLAWLQRGALSLHAATVRVGDEVVAVAGHRGAGKSTTAMGLRARGHQLLVDDVTLLEQHDGDPFVRPFRRNVHLLPESATQVGVDHGRLDPLHGRSGKVAFRPEEPAPHAQRLDRIVVLVRGRVDSALSVELHGASRVQHLEPQTSRDRIAPSVLGHSMYFGLVTGLADAVPMQVVVRPADEPSFDQVLDLIEAGRSVHAVRSTSAAVMPPGTS